MSAGVYVVVDESSEILDPPTEPEPTSFLDRIRAFFRKIIEWFKNLFKIG